MAKAKRLYQPIWETVKNNGTCKIEGHPKLFGRIKKAVYKEKDMDLGFKAMAERTHTLDIQQIEENGKHFLIFRLKASVIVKDL